MKKSLLSAVAIAAFGLLFSNFAFSQDNELTIAAGDMYVISAKAGGVNFVDGKVSIVRKDGKSGLLLATDKIEVGDQISTGAEGKTEILLNPGSFVRLSANAKFEFQTTDLDNLKLKLSSGSAIFEVYADNEFKVTLDLPDANIELTKSGVYRVDVLPDGSGKVTVWKGKVLLGNQEIKAGKTAVVKGNNASAVAKFDRDNKDAFDVWSDLRAKESARINKRLQRDALSNSLMNSYNLGNWNMFGSFGVWVFDPFSRRWCFLPFGSGWSSPSGYSYSFDLYRCNLPRRVYNQTPGSTTVNTPATPQTPTEVHERDQVPSFRRFENNQGVGRSGGGGGLGNSDSNSETRSTSSNNGGGWSPSSSRSESSSTPTQSTPSSNQSQPVFSPPSRTETKNVKID